MQTNTVLAVHENISPVMVSGFFSDNIQRFISSLDAKARTKETYRGALKVLHDWILERGCLKPSREDILAYKGYLQAKKYIRYDDEIRGLSPQTISAYLTATRRFFAWLEAEKIYPNIARDIKGMKRPRGFLRDTLVKDEVRRLLAGAQGTDLNALRDYALINLMARTGLRTIEVSRAQIEDIGREGGETVLRVWGKGRDAKDEFVILTAETYRPVLDYLQARKNYKASEPLFCSHSNRNLSAALTTRSIRRIIDGNLKAVGLKTPKITAHSLRHTAGTIALMNGADLLSVKDMLRHSNINTTLTYAHNISRISKGAEKYISF